MSLQDPIADMLTCLRNAQSVGIKNITVPFSTLKKQILAVLKEEGYVAGWKVTVDGVKKNLFVDLKYYQGKPVIETIKRVSRPALRVYSSYSEFPMVRGNLGVAIVSTPKGVMTHKQAINEKVGGEIICTVE